MSHSRPISVGDHRLEVASIVEYKFECIRCGKKRRLPSHFEGVPCVGPSYP